MDFVEHGIASLLTSPLLFLADWAVFLRRLSPDDREVVRQVRRAGKRQRAALAVIAGGVALASSSSAPDMPFAVRLVVWAITWPLVALAIASWSLRIRRRDHALWEESLRGRPVDAVRGVVLFLAALMPAAIVTVMFE